MRKLRFIWVITVSAGLLSSCGLFDFEEREPWRAQVEARCLASKTVIPSSFITPMQAIEGPRTCGVDHPFHVTGLNQGSIQMAPRARLGCPMVPALEKWMLDTVQPAAIVTFGTQVVEIKNMASYGCRSRNNQSGAPLSEHAFANALDVGAFRLADGREVIVKSGWHGAPEEQLFLRQVLAGACNVFTTVLGPGSDRFHSDHFHLDLRLHDPRGLRHVCKPIPAPDLPPAGTPLPGGPVIPTASLPPNASPAVPPQIPVAANPPPPQQTPYPVLAYPPAPLPASGLTPLSQTPLSTQDPFALDDDVTGTIGH
jgi:hypothetical protein